jgi:hypothetical protein
VKDLLKLKTSILGHRKFTWYQSIDTERGNQTRKTQGFARELQVVHQKEGWPCYQLSRSYGYRFEG